jgi:hypothetical protein
VKGALSERGSISTRSGPTALRVAAREGSEFVLDALDASDRSEPR